MKTGINLLLWTDDVLSIDLPPLLDSIRAAGYDGVEVPIFAPEAEAYRRVGELIARAGLECTALTVRTPADDPISPDPEVRRRAVAMTNATVDCCKAMGADLLVGPLHSALGNFSGLKPSEREMDWAVESLRESADYAAGCGVRLAVEYLNRFEAYLLNSSADAARLVDAVGRPNCRMMYDTFHAHIEEKSVAEAIRAGGDRLVHVHVSENDRSTPGTGQIHWRETFDALEEIGYDGWLMIEAFGTALPGLAAATKIWRPMFESQDRLMRESIEFLRREVPAVQKEAV